MPLTKPFLEQAVAYLDMAVKGLGLLGALIAVLYSLSSRQLQKLNKQESDALRQKVDAQQAILANSQITIEDLKGQNLRLGVQFEEEQKARLNLQGKLAGRVLSDVQRNQMIELLRPYAGQKIDFRYFTEFETSNFAKQILAAFQAAGWQVSVTEFDHIQPFYGILCGGWDLEQPSLLGLKAALKIADKDATAQHGGAATVSAKGQDNIVDRLWLTIGLKKPRV